MANVTFKHETTGTIEIDTETLSGTSVDFLLQYGIRQYLADGAAVAKEDKEGNDRTPDEIFMLKQEGIHKRLANIETGIFPAGGGSRDPHDTETNRVAREAFKKAVRASGKKMPADKEVAKEMFKAYRAKHLAHFEEIATRNLAAMADLAPAAL